MDSNAYVRKTIVYFTLDLLVHTHTLSYLYHPPYMFDETFDFIQFEREVFATHPNGVGITNEIPE